MTQEPAETVSVQRYSSVAVALHWMIAVMILTQLLLGWRVSDSSGQDRIQALQLHKSIGITVLIVALVRLIWRLAHRPPANAGLKPFERALSTWVHRALYLIMLALPLTGWAMISNSRGGATTLVFGSIPWPPLPLLGQLSVEMQDAVVEFFDESHLALVWLTVAMLALHLAGALRHQFLLRDAVLSRMAVWLRPRRVWDSRLLVIPVMGSVAFVLAYWRTPVVPPRPKPTALAQADIFLDVVQPALLHRCETCHGNDTTRGAFSVDGYDALMDGGKHGPAITAGQPATSELFRRISLPSSDEHHMPKRGHTPLTAQQIEVIGWWIAQGAPRSGRADMLETPAEVQTALANILKLGAQPAAARTASALDVDLPGVAPADPAVIAALEIGGFIVRPITKEAHLLEVRSAGSRSLTAAQRRLLDLLAPQVFSLNLSRGEVAEADLESIARMTNLHILRLEWDSIDDAALTQLQRLRELRTLNLTGTKITDRGLKSLVSKMPNLGSVSVWQTGVSRQLIQDFRATRSDMVINDGTTFSVPPLAEGNAP